jgi:hypothetical protein
MLKTIDFIGDLKSGWRFNPHTLSIGLKIGKKPLFLMVFMHFL